jgi:hypothetical protein
MRNMMIGALASVVAMTFTTTGFAQGTEAEAKAMLTRAVTAVKADQAKALGMFTAGDSGFRDRDLYVFCANLTDGKIVALGNPNVSKQLLGTDIRALKDATGKVYGPDLFAGAQKDAMSQVEYMFPRPGADQTPVQKISFVTKASNDVGCGVGYYK